MSVAFSLTWDTGSWRQWQLLSGQSAELRNEGAPWTPREELCPCPRKQLWDSGRACSVRDRSQPAAPRDRAMQQPWRPPACGWHPEAGVPGGGGETSTQGVTQGDPRSQTLPRVISVQGCGLPVVWAARAETQGKELGHYTEGTETCTNA